MVMNLKLKASHRLAALLGAAHATAAAATFALDIGPGGQLLLTFTLLLSFVLSLRRAALLSTPDAVVEIEWSDEGTLNFKTRDGTWHSARLMPSTFVTPWLTVINLRTGQRPRVRHVVLMADSAGAEEYRRLRVRLQWDRARYA